MSDTGELSRRTDDRKGRDQYRFQTKGEREARREREGGRGGREEGGRGRERREGERRATEEGKKKELSSHTGGHARSQMVS